MAIVDRVHNLFEYAFGNVFLKLAALSHIREQVTARHQFHYKKDVLLSLEILVKPHDVLVAGLLKDHYLLHYFFRLCFLLERTRIDALYRHELVCYQLPRQVHFTKCALTQHLADTVKVYSCGRALA